MQLLLHLSKQSRSCRFSHAPLLSPTAGAFPGPLLHTQLSGYSLLLLHVAACELNPWVCAQGCPAPGTVSVCLSWRWEELSTAGSGGREMSSQLSISCFSSNGTEMLKVLRISLTAYRWIFGCHLAGLPQDCKERAEKSFVCVQSNPKHLEKQNQALPEGTKALNMSQTG